MDHAATRAIRNIMIVQKRDGLYHDVQRLNIRKASEDCLDHLSISADTKTYLQSQDLDTWYRGARARLCPSLQLIAIPVHGPNSEIRDPISI